MVISFLRRSRQAAPFPVSSFTPVARAFLHASITPVCTVYSGLDAFLIIFARLAVLPLFGNLKQRVPLGFCLCLLSLGEGNDHVFPLDFLVKCFNRARLSIRKHRILGGQALDEVGCKHMHIVHAVIIARLWAILTRDSKYTAPQRLHNFFRFHSFVHPFSGA
mgnify:CR=1 FL=1